MRYFGRNVFLLCLVLSCSLFGGTKPTRHIVKHLPLDDVSGSVLKNTSNSQYLPGHIIVKLMPQTTMSLSKSTFGIESIDRVLSRALGVAKAQMFPTLATPQRAGDVDLTLMYVVSFSSPNDPLTIANELSDLPEVQYAEPWFINTTHKNTSTPNDPLFGSQWALPQVHAPEAWDITQGDSTVVIAIVDSGVEWTHPDLADNIYINHGETGIDASTLDKRSNLVDDDGNGYVDDWHGWDLVGATYVTFDPATTKGDNDPSPKGTNNNHGTHVAGIAAAVTNNHIGVASIAPKCRILPVKVSADDDVRDNGSAYILAGYQGIVYAAMMKAQIISCSWGGYGGAQAEQDMVDFATQRGSLVVAAAGNDNSDAFQTPASYRGVLSVASTGTGDLKSYFSNYGDNVDVCAPGEGIWSTIYHFDYAQLSGTSMATPLAAGVAALVKSKFPSYTGLQVGERVRVTCDNIDLLNSTYAGKLGRGRVNALRALQDPPVPSVRLLSSTFNDFPGGNGNGMAEPAETLNVVCSFRNYLAPTSSGATVQLTSTDTRYITVIQGSSSIASLGTLDSSSNKAAPFRVYVQRTVPQSYTARLQLTYTDGSFTDVQYIKFLVNPTYATHNVNALELTLTNNGRIGFYDFPDNLLGKGFIFNGMNFLFEGGLIVGTSSTQIDDVVRNEGGTGQNADFGSKGFYTLQSPGIISDQDGSTAFNDSLASLSNKVGLLVSMYSYAFSDPADSKYIILQYNLKNNTRNALTNLYAGLFLDWDVGNYEADISSYDASRSLGYCYDSGLGTLTRREYLGVVALGGAAGFRSLVRDSTDLTRPSKWDWISGGFKRTQAGPTDIHQVISSGPYTLGSGVTKVIAFALVAGDSSLANIRLNADAAKARWQTIAKTVGIGDNAASPARYQLAQNYPNPFNPSTTLQFQVPQKSFVSLKVFDLLGRELATLVNEERQAGIYSVSWDASRLPSGVYFYRLRAGDFVETKKMVFAK
jgi:serine protease